MSFVTTVHGEVVPREIKCARSLVLRASVAPCDSMVPGEVAVGSLWG